MAWNKIAKKYRISTKTIAKIAKSRKSQADASDAVQVFKLLRKGMTPDRIVIKLGVHPNLVGELLEEYEILKAYNPRHCDDCFDRGYDAGCEDHWIAYPCSKCGRDMIFDLCSMEARKRIMRILLKGGIGNWYHTPCKRES
jgi:transcription initiation factor IIE alpha subunit